ncbi:vesicle-associated protein 1-2-like isoform X2 [Gossypium australe]|uniref:Vesicle-associated protein 1-2-like isoform X2 n=1 Tax=Gossypium australe TaxID=47621 RepID=A0A5B6TBH1_9ROSI|nr:vesicle-associated protein 1-2-like isoform X2 [Gossypium australe]
MSTGQLLSIEPQELQFPFELRKQISCSLNLSNKTDNYVAFKVKTTNPKKYCVRPNTGVVLPRSTCNVAGLSFTLSCTKFEFRYHYFSLSWLMFNPFTMQAQKEAPTDMQCKDKFLLQSVVASPGATTKDITAEMFNKESGHNVEECKLRVVYVAPPRPPSPVREGSEEGSSPRASVSDNGSFNAAELTSARSLISKLTEEKNSAIQQNSKLQQELVRTVETRSQKKPKWYSIHLCISCGLDRHHFGIPIEENMTTTELHILRCSSMQLPWLGKEMKFGKLVRFTNLRGISSVSFPIL